MHIENTVFCPFLLHIFVFLPFIFRFRIVIYSLYGCHSKMPQTSCNLMYNKNWLDRLKIWTLWVTLHIQGRTADTDSYLLHLDSVDNFYILTAVSANFQKSLSSTIILLFIHGVCINPNISKFYPIASYSKAMNVESRYSSTEFSLEASRIKCRQSYVGNLYFLPLIMQESLKIYRRHSSILIWRHTLCRASSQLIYLVSNLHVQYVHDCTKPSMVVWVVFFSLNSNGFRPCFGKECC